MGEIFNTFGVTWGKFLAQVLIFVIVYLILKKFAFGPIQAILEDRKQRIAEGEKNLEKIKNDLESAEAERDRLIQEANARAEGMITDARESAEAVGAKERQKAVTEANQIVSKAREASTLERDQLLGELKRDFGRLVVDTTSKVTGKVLDDKDQKRINEETAAQVAL